MPGSCQETRADHPPRGPKNKEGFKELEMKKEFGKGRDGGSPLRVVQTSIELLANETLPSTVPHNIATMYEVLYQ